MTRAVVTGGAGFLGSHVCDRLLAEGWEVLCLDSMLTGSEANLTEAASEPRFSFREADVTQDLEVSGDVDAVLHMASPASPPDYLRHPLATLRVGSYGTHRALELAKDKGARFFLSSTSEVYGDPLVHPQPETYFGNVNPIGPRSVYDEAKRYAEAVTMAYHRDEGLPVRIVRIFNTYGPRMRSDDGRAVPNFIRQSLRNEPITVHGDGSQTRSLCYVDDLVEGIWRLLISDETGPINLGNPEEVSMRDLAERVREMTGSTAEIVFVARPTDDPEVRCPDISEASKCLDWKPEVSIDEGLRRMVAWARAAWGRS